MNKLILNNGGHPLFIEDLNHLQDAFRQGFEAICEGLMSDGISGVVLSGCKKTSNGNGTVNISDGFVYYNQEIWKVDGQANLPDTSAIYLKASTDAYLEPQNYLYENGATHQVLQVRKMNVSSSSGVFFSTFAKSIGDAMRRQATSWTTFPNDAFFSGTEASSVQPAYRVDSIGMVHLVGEIVVYPNQLNAPAPYNKNAILKLPKGIIPDRLYSFDNQTTSEKFRQKIIVFTGNPEGLIVHESQLQNTESFYILNLSGIRYFASTSFN